LQTVIDTQHTGAAHDSMYSSIGQDTIKSILKIQDDDTFNKYSEDRRYKTVIFKIVSENCFWKILLHLPALHFTQWY